MFAEAAVLRLRPAMSPRLAPDGSGFDFRVPAPSPGGVTVIAHLGGR